MLVIAETPTSTEFSDTLQVVFPRSPKHLAPFILNVHPRSTLFTGPTCEYQLSMLRTRDQETVIGSEVPEAGSDEHVVLRVPQLRRRGVDQLYRLGRSQVEFDVKGIPVNCL